MPVVVSTSLRRGLVVAIALVFAGSALAIVTSTSARAASSPTTVQMSVTTGGFGPGNGKNDGGSDFERRLVSDDGRYVAFESSGPIVPGQNVIEWQVVRRDRHLGTTTLISKSSAGVKGNGGSFYPSISADGQVIAFHSHASNLVPGDTNGTSDIFVHDVRTGITKRASVTSTGAQVPTGQVAGDNVVGPPSISPDGRWVGFTARVQGFTDGDDVNSATKAYLHDRQTGGIEVVSRSSANAVVDAGGAVSPSVDGNIVAFYSGNAHVTPGDSNGDPDIFVRNRITGTTTKVPAGEDGAIRHALSGQGRFVVFESRTGNLSLAEQDGKVHIFVHDLQTSTTTRVSVATGGTKANNDSRHPAISKDGRYVTFHSTATNLVPGDTNGQSDVFRHDRTTGQTIRASVTANGAQNFSWARASSISGDGQHVTFESQGSALTPVATRGYGQVFVRDLAGRWPALHARLGALPGRAYPDTTHRVAAYDIRTGPALAITWTPVGGTKGGVVRQAAAVSGTAFTLRTPQRPGTYNVVVAYAGHTVGSRTVNVLKPTAAKLAKSVKKGKRLKVRTAGVAPGQKVRVRFNPRGKSGKVVQRSGKVNQKGILKVKAPAKRAKYQVTVQSKGEILRKGTVRIR